MSDPLIREMDNYVVLVPGESEQFLNKEQTLIWLQSWLNKFDSLPLDLACKSSIEKAAQHLLGYSLRPGNQSRFYSSVVCRAA